MGSLREGIRRAGYNPDSCSYPAVGWGAADVGTQPFVGLLSERRTWPGAFDRHHPATDGKTLERRGIPMVKRLPRSEWRWAAALAGALIAGALEANAQSTPAMPVAPQS